MKSIADRSLSVVLIVLIPLIVINSVWWITEYLSMDLTSGVWAGLAMDVADGVLYRPLYGQTGFGGTRYMPFFPVLHGLLISLGLPAVAAGLVLNAAILVALMVGVYRLLCITGAKRRLALAGTLMVMAPSSFFLLATSLRGDALPLMLGIWGLVFVAQERAGLASLIGAAFFFALAFFSKFSSIAASAAGFFFLWFQVGKRRALELLGLTFVVCLLLLGLVQVLSGGRFIEIMLACAGGGMDIYSVSKAPYRMLAYMDYPTLLMFFAGLGAGWHIWKTGYKKVPVLFFIWNIAATLIIFMSPGTIANHLLDLFVASLIVTIASMVHEQGLSMRTGVIFLSLIVLFGIEVTVQRMGEQVVKPMNNYAIYSQAADMAGSGAGPILSENPMIPVINGQTPYLADPYLFAILAKRNPDLRNKMEENIRQGIFSAVVLANHAGGASIKFLDDSLVDLVKEHYQKTGQVDGFTVYTRKDTP